MTWVSMDDFLRETTREETEWAAQHAPNPSKPPRKWRPPSSPVPFEELAFQEGETQVARVLRLVDSGYPRLSIAAAVGLSTSRVSQITKERKRLGVLES